MDGHGRIEQTDRGEIIIDWIDATRGNPLADVVRTTVLALGPADGNQTSSSSLRSLARRLHAEYIRQYFSLRRAGVSEYRRWLPIVAAARLSENIPELEGWLVGEAQKIE